MPSASHYRRRITPQSFSSLPTELSRATPSQSDVQECAYVPKAPIRYEKYEGTERGLLNKNPSLPCINYDADNQNRDHKRDWRILFCLCSTSQLPPSTSLPNAQWPSVSLNNGGHSLPPFLMGLPFSDWLTAYCCHLASGWILKTVLFFTQNRL